MITRADIRQLDDEKIDMQFPGHNPIGEVWETKTPPPQDFTQRAYHADTKLSLEMLTVSEERIERARLDRNHYRADLIANSFASVRSDYLGNAITLGSLLHKVNDIVDKIYNVAD